MFCNKCGSELNNNAKFCNKCGNKINNNSTIAEKDKGFDIHAETLIVDSADNTFVNQNTQRIPQGVNKAQQNSNSQVYVPQPHSTNSNSTAIIGILIFLCAVLLAACIFVVYILLNTNNNNDKATENKTEKIESNSNSSNKSNDNSSKQSSDYKLSDSNSRYYSENELNNMSVYDLYIARNEIYARHGRDFKNADLKNYFSSKTWYHVVYTPTDFDAHQTTILNDYERKNADLMLKIEKTKNSPYLN